MFDAREDACHAERCDEHGDAEHERDQARERCAEPEHDLHIRGEQDDLHAHEEEADRAGAQPREHLRLAQEYFEELRITSLRIV